MNALQTVVCYFNFSILIGFYFRVNDIVSAMKFGRFGREESALVMITISGGLTVKILKRTAQFDKLESALAPTLNKVSTGCPSFHVICSSVKYRFAFEKWI